MALITIRIERPVRGRARKGGHSTRRGRVFALLCAVGASTAGALALSGAFASATVVPITPHSVYNTSVGANHSVSPVVSGGATTVPTDATRVVFAVTVKGGAAAAGTLKAYPNAYAAGASGDSLSWNAGQTVTGTFTEPVGLQNKVTFVNQSSATIVLTVKITGYTTEVHASDITSGGGSAGDVLTNTGSGAAWRAAASGDAHANSNNFTTTALSSSVSRAVASVNVPAGTYLATFTGTLSANSATQDYTACSLLGPSGATVSVLYANASSANSQNTIATQGLINASNGGTVHVDCLDSYSAGTVYYPSLVATRVSSASGAVANAAVRQAPDVARGARAPAP